MIHIHITGSSRGIGNALARALLKEGHTVDGYSRTNDLNHDLFTFHPVDLTDLSETKKIDFRLGGVKVGDRVVLLNNAGMIQPVSYLGKLDEDLLVRHLHLNMVSPLLLMNGFLRTFNGQELELVIINVSSGAGKYPVDGWSAYCSAKAAMDMATGVGNLENGKQGGNVRYFSIAPGIVDTPMQADIRQVNENDFSRIAEFIDYKESNKLADPNEVARKFVKVIEQPDQYKEDVFRF